MPYPQDAIAPHEELVLNLHPHWWFIAKSGALVVLAMVLGVYVAATDRPDALKMLFAVAVLASLVFFLVRFAKWITTHFVLTSDRIMSREGAISKRGVEIPLERINTVIFEQSIIERVLGLGDLVIESASTDGSQRFEDIRRPSDVQKEIYIQMERNENNKMDRMGQAMNRPDQAPAPQPAGPTIADQIQQLAQLRDAGHLTEMEFQTKKAELLSRM